MAKAFMTDQSDNNNLVLIDSLNLAFRWKHKGGTFASNMLETINSFKRSYNARDVIVAGEGGSAWRKAIYPEYKANRKAKVDTMSDQDKEDWDNFIQEYSKAMDLVGIVYPFIRFDGIEADDIIAWYAQNATDIYDHIWIISTDKDFDQLIGDEVSRFSYIKKAEITKQTWTQHHNCDIDEYISIKVLMGDAGDNVPGIKGVGEKRAGALVNKYGSAFDIYDSIPLEGTQKFLQAANEFKDQILVNYKLMDLTIHCEDILGTENIDKLKELINVR